MDLQLVAPVNAPDARICSSGRRPREISQPSWLPRHFREEAAPLNVHQAAAGDLADAHRLAEDLVQARMAPLDVLCAAHAHTGGSAWIYGRSDGAGVSGVLLTLPLNAEGERALLGGAFNAGSPDLEHLCRSGDAVSAMYIWFGGGRGLRARGAVMKTALAWRDGAYSSLRAYSRAATSSGARGLGAHGFQPVAHPGLMLCDARR